MKTLVIAVFVAVATLFGAPNASADPQWQHDVLCSSNMAYRHAHAETCKPFPVNSHGGGGGPDSDHDGTNNFKDNFPNDPSKQ